MKGSIIDHCVSCCSNWAYKYCRRDGPYCMCKVYIVFMMDLTVVQGIHVIWNKLLGTHNANFNNKKQFLFVFYNMCLLFVSVTSIIVQTFGYRFHTHWNHACYSANVVVLACILCSGKSTVRYFQETTNPDQRWADKTHVTYSFHFCITDMYIILNAGKFWD